MQRVVKKSVFIPSNEEVTYHYYEREKYPPGGMQESMKRKCMEESVISKPDTELGRIKRIISSWRKYDISIVFGNLGRQPHLLNYYLDFCFGHQENIHLFCRWKLDSNYQTKNVCENCDFLFLVEPPFGHAILKRPQVKHLVVLTSHLNLIVTEPNTQYYYLHLSGKTHLPPNDNLENGEVFKPPIFHENLHNLPNGPIFLDVRKSKSANEAYLRLLTGKEMISKRPFKILIDDHDRKIIQMSLRVTERKLQKRNYSSWDKFFYNCV